MPPHAQGDPVNFFFHNKKTSNRLELKQTYINLIQFSIKNAFEHNLNTAKFISRPVSFVVRFR